MKSPRFILLVFLYFTEAINNYDGHELPVKIEKYKVFFAHPLYLHIHAHHTPSTKYIHTIYILNYF
jgi:hypothetical protein